MPSYNATSSHSEKALVSARALREEHARAAALYAYRIERARRSGSVEAVARWTTEYRRSAASCRPQTSAARCSSTSMPRALRDPRSGRVDTVRQLIYNRSIRPGSMGFKRVFPPQMRARTFYSMGSRWRTDRGG